MKKTILTLFAVMITTLSCNAQRIEMEKVFGGYNFSQNGEKLTMNNLVVIMETNNESYELMKSARSSNTLAQIIGGAGGFLIGWPIGTAIGGGDPNWVLAGVGVGLAVISFPISSNANKKAKQAVELYNAGITSTSHHELNPKFRLIVNRTGIGVTMSF